MRGFVDLHSHWIPGVDDGVKTAADGVALLKGLRAAGFDLVIATPHMRPGMFDNERANLEEAFAAISPRVSGQPDLPTVHLASEHFFDDVTFTRLMKGQGLPYPDLAGPSSGSGERVAKRKRGVLVELHPQTFPTHLAHRFFDLGRAGLRPVLAHPERYQPVWKDDRCLDPLLDAGACLLLDICALVGKYGRASQKAAEKLLEEEAYEAACSDAHRPDDTTAVRTAIELLERRVGKRETDRLLRDGPRGILGLGSP